MTSRLSSSSGHKRSTPYVYNFEKRQTAADCTTQTLYKAPLADAVVDAMAGKLQVSWQTTCFNTIPETIDLRLYAPHRTNITERRLQIWKNVPYAPGSVEIDLYPRWWDNAPSIQLQFSIQESGNPFSSDYGPGPEFTATYTDTGVVNEKNDLNIIDKGYTYLKEFIKSLSGGEIAGAVIGTLLFIGLVVGGIFFFRRTRAKRAEKSKRFSQMVDKRMSTISQNWSSISPSAAQAAIRNSMSVYGRPSGDISMQSTASVNGAGNIPGNTVGSGLRPQRERSGTRVSFAPESMHGRPSSSIRNSTATNANRPYHYADAPPLPTRQTSTENMTLSPTQAVGAFDLSPQDVDSRASQYIPDVGPALQMMRESETAHEPMFSPKKNDTPLPPVPAMTNPKSPVGMMPMMDSGLSPDALLRGYATNKDSTMRRTNSLSVHSSEPSVRTLSPMSTGPAYPSPVAGRTLYSPQTPTQVDNNPFRRSMAPTVASAYSGLDEEYESEQHQQQQQRTNRF